MRFRPLLASILVFAAIGADAAEVLKAYGPGGPAPALKEAAQAFERRTGTKVEITAGPTAQWQDQAKTDADLIFSGSEHMMTDFVKALDGIIVESTIVPLYLRPLAILVRSGNPKAVKGVADLFKPGLKILVVNGAGQTGAWEDMAGRSGDIAKLRALRSNIVFQADSSAQARQRWIDDSTLDVWLIWNIWQVANKELAEVVPIEPRYAIYRDSGIALTRRSVADARARAFIEFLLSPDGAAIFRRWGWEANAA